MLRRFWREKALGNFYCLARQRRTKVAVNRDVHGTLASIAARRRVTIVALGWILLTALPGMAQYTSHYTPSPVEYLSLPEYCRDLLDPKREDAGTIGREKWQPALGPTVFHIHHYCYGLIAEMRAKRAGRPERERQHYWARVVAELTYVIDRAPPDFVLLPEVLYRRGNALGQTNQVIQAIGDFKQSSRIKPDYYPAYRGLAELHKKNGRADLAAAVVDEGLSRSPNSKALLELKRELSGSAAATKPAAAKKESTRSPADAKPAEAGRESDVTAAKRSEDGAGLTQREEKSK